MEPSLRLRKEVIGDLWSSDKIRKSFRPNPLAEVAISTAVLKQASETAGFSTDSAIAAVAGLTDLVGSHRC
jgi:hypothetical protein